MSLVFELNDVAVRELERASQEFFMEKRDVVSNALSLYLYVGRKLREDPARAFAVITADQVENPDIVEALVRVPGFFPAT